MDLAPVLASGGLFLLRGLAVQLGGASWAMAAPLRYLRTPESTP